MLINCPSCQVKYLLNSADLRTQGRIVKCAKCNYQWFQKPNIEFELHRDDLSSNNTRDTYNYNKTLPSTYVEEEKTSFKNSLLMLIFIFIVIGIYFFIINLDHGIVYLFRYYIEELISSINLIIKDLAKFSYKILN